MCLFETLLLYVIKLFLYLILPVAANKPVMLKCNLLEKILPHGESDMSAVHFKLLGTLRMVLDGQEAGVRSLVANEQFVIKLIGWCTVEEHAGVKGKT